MAYVEGEMPVSVGGYNNGFGSFFGGDGIWAIILFAMIFGWGGNGWGFGGGNTTTDVNSAVQRGFDTSAIMGKLDALGVSVADADKELVGAINGVNTSILSSGYDTRLALQNCCCENRSQIADLKYALASEACDIRNAITMQTRDITDAQRASTDAILGFLTNEKIADLQARNVELSGELSQNKQTNAIINALRPVAQPAYITCSPFESYMGIGTCGSIQ
jgi:hypothetical protein